MKLRPIAIAIAVACFALTPLCMAQDVTAGTWKVNAAKSKYGPSAQTKYETITIAVNGDDVEMTLDGTDPSGNAIHTQWKGKYDGKQYPVTGDPSADSRAYKMVNGHTFEATSMKDGKPMNTARVAYSADGKTRTVTVHGKSADGKAVRRTAVYNKE
jgi:hypothetical protein